MKRVFEFKFIAIFLEILIFGFAVSFGSSSLFAANSVLMPQPTHEIPRRRNYPETDWVHLKRGVNYRSNVLLVNLRKGVSQTEIDRMMAVLSSLGNVKIHSYHKDKFRMYEVKITNGMTEQQATEDLREDPAVEAVSVDEMNIKVIHDISGGNLKLQKTN